MNYKFLLATFLFISIQSFSQEKNKVLFTIDNEPYYSQEFIKVYNKNKTLLTAEKTQSAENYLKLFVDYKLKVKQAKDLKLDTAQSFKKELKAYKNKLVLPYLKDESVTNKLVSEAYERLKTEVSVSHILIFLEPNAPPKDTLEAYNKLLEAKQLLEKGAKFEEVAKKYSQDPSVQSNGGMIGYFTALQMVYPFETAAYNTPVDSVSKPFRTKYGYHILKVHGRRPSKGEIEVAHIMLRGDSLKVKKKMDSLYQLLVDKKFDFGHLAAKVSEDRASAVNGGKLGRFGVGRMIESFYDAAFSLNEEGEISKPVKTKYGWHIIKLIKKYPLKSFSEERNRLTKKIEKDPRSNLIGASVINKLLRQYNIVENKSALEQLKNVNWNTNPSEFKQVILTIENKKIPQSKFLTYSRRVRNKDIETAFKDFKMKELLVYYKEHIENSNADFAATYNEFKDGLLLFDLLEKKVWNKSKDSAGLAAYFNKNKQKKYKHKKLEEIKGLVISDYQDYLEKEWIAQLHAMYEVKFNKREKKKVIRQLKRN